MVLLVLFFNLMVRMLLGVISLDLHQFITFHQLVQTLLVVVDLLMLLLKLLSMLVVLLVLLQQHNLLLYT